MTQVRNRSFLIINVQFYILLDYFTQGEFDVQFSFYDQSFQSLCMCYMAEEASIIFVSEIVTVVMNVKTSHGKVHFLMIVFAIDYGEAIM